MRSCSRQCDTVGATTWLLPAEGWPGARLSGHPFHFSDLRGGRIPICIIPLDGAIPGPMLKIVPRPMVIARLLPRLPSLRCFRHGALCLQLGGVRLQRTSLSWCVRLCDHRQLDSKACRAGVEFTGLMFAMRSSVLAPKNEGWEFLRHITGH